MPTIRLDDAELFYDERGRGPPLVFLHGLGSSARDWEAQLAHFSSTRRCVAFDIPGCGRSKDLRHPAGPYSLAGFARAIAAGMRRLDLAPADVVGLSLGGMTGLQLALDAPDVVRSLTVVNAVASVVPTTLRERVLLTVRSIVTRTLGPPGAGPPGRAHRAGPDTGDTGRTSAAGHACGDAGLGGGNRFLDGYREPTRRHAPGSPDARLSPPVCPRPSVPPNSARPP